jgi:hypothetical protein
MIETRSGMQPLQRKSLSSFLSTDMNTALNVVASDSACLYYVILLSPTGFAENQKESRYPLSATLCVHDLEAIRTRMTMEVCLFLLYICVYNY